MVYKELSDNIIIVLKNEESVQYFIDVEQDVLCEVPSFPMALFVMFTAYLYSIWSTQRKLLEHFSSCKIIFQLILIRLETILE